MFRFGRHLLLFSACLTLLAAGCADSAVESRIARVESGLLAALGDLA